MRYRLPTVIALVCILLGLAGLYAVREEAMWVPSEEVDLGSGDLWYSAELEPLARNWGKVAIVVDGAVEAKVRTTEAAEATLHRLVARRRFDSLILSSNGRVVAEVAVASGQTLALRLYGLATVASRRQKLGPFRFADDFGREKIGKGDGWEVLEGRWGTLWNEDRAADPNRFVAQGESISAMAGYMLTGHDFWDDYTFEVTLQLHEAEQAGVIIGWQGQDDYLTVTLARNGPRLRRHSQRGSMLLCEQPLVIFPDNWCRLRVKCRADGQLFVDVDGVAAFAEKLNHVNHGRIGLVAEGGAALFDDLELESTQPISRLSAREARPLQVSSEPYSVKPRYEKDDRDDHLERWAKDADAWLPAPDDREWLRFHLPLFSPFRIETVEGAKVRIRDVQGRVVEATQAPDAPGPYWIECQPGKAGPPHLWDDSVWQELFEQAPANWLAIDGTWQMTNRWQCEPKWSFYGGIGTEAVVLYSKPFFEGDQVHEFYHGMKDIFARQFENRRYARHDVNVSFMTDGRDLFSGYTFMYGGHENKASYLYRGREIVAINETHKFLPFVDIYDLHLFWRRLRVEAVGEHIRVLLDDEVVIDYLEEDPLTAPKGGQIALWTYRNGIVYGRFNSSASHLRIGGSSLPTPIFSHEGAAWKALQPGRVTVDPQGWATNNWGGGTFAMEFPLDSPVDLLATPRLALDLEIPEGTMVNLHLVVSGKPLIVPLTAPIAATYRVLGHRAWYEHEWQPYAMDPLGLPVIDGKPAESFASPLALDLLALVRERYPRLNSPKLQRLTIGNTDHGDYLMAGLRGNRPGARYRVGIPSFLPAAE